MNRGKLEYLEKKPKFLQQLYDSQPDIATIETKFTASSANITRAEHIKSQRDNEGSRKRPVDRLNRSGTPNHQNPDKDADFDFDAPQVVVLDEALRNELLVGNTDLDNQKLLELAHLGSEIKRESRSTKVKDDASQGRIVFKKPTKIPTNSTASFLLASFGPNGDNSSSKTTKTEKELEMETNNQQSKAQKRNRNINGDTSIKNNNKAKANKKQKTKDAKKSKVLLSFSEE